MASVIVSLWEEKSALERLAAAGHAAARKDHDDDRVLEEWRELVLDAVSRG
jgi:hypothetical protein